MRDGGRGSREGKEKLKGLRFHFFLSIIYFCFSSIFEKSFAHTCTLKEMQFCFLDFSNFLFHASAVKISDFQPSVIPVRSSTRLTIVTADQLNASSAVWCRLGDMSVPAEVKGGLVFCDMPPMRDTDKAALHLDVDGKLFKAKKPLRLHSMSAIRYRS